MNKIIKDEYVGMDRSWLKEDIELFARNFGVRHEMPDVGRRSGEQDHSNNMVFGKISSSIFKINDYPAILSNVYDASLLSSRILDHRSQTSFLGNIFSGFRNIALKALMGARSESPCSSAR